MNALPALAMLAMVLAAGSIRAAETRVEAIGVENQYADVISQIGGDLVQVRTIVSDPNTDPHTFEASPRIAAEFAAADLVVKNGIGYDSWADKFLAAVPKADRMVIDVQRLLGLPDSTRNPHLWYDPRTMPAVAKAVADDLSALLPGHGATFAANLKTFDASLAVWNAAIAVFRTDHPNTEVAVTEPVADYMLEAAGCDILTPHGLRAAIMNGTDPSPQDVTAQNRLFADHKVKVFVYNQQVTDSLTQSFLDLAKRNGIPVVGVYETMPTPGYDYQSWMLAEVMALRKAVTDKVSTETLQGAH